MASTGLEQVDDMLDRACTSLRSADFEVAQRLFEQALSVDFDHPKVLYALKCSRFFDEWRARLEALEDPLERGDAWIVSYKAFKSFECSIGERFEELAFAFKCFAFSQAQRCYERFVEREGGTDVARDAGLRLGRCKKARGDFEGALGEFEKAAASSKEDAEILAELADAYALINESRFAKALFREAFFIDPSRIDLSLLEAPLIRLLIDRVEALGYAEREIPEWVPVYGAIWGVFSVRRELKAVEVGRLRQSVYQMENEVKDGRGDLAVAIPRLINRYFWQIDHFIAVKEDRKRIEETLLKVKLLDPAIHKQYVS
jgi:tetratricopeptide (TPR) repeat protein